MPSASSACLYYGNLISVYLLSSVLFRRRSPCCPRRAELIANGKLFEHVGFSMMRIAVGFVLGSSIGIVVGLLMGSFLGVRRFMDPYVETLRFIPAVAMITVAVIWFGIGEASKFFIITYATVFIVILTTARGRVEYRAQQDPRGTVARRDPNAGFFPGHAAGYRAVHSHGHARGHG